LDSKKPKLYNLTMFPYPSADYLHIGHILPYSGADVYGRYKKLNGKNVFEPTGYDSFGLPAENFAIKKKTHPKKVIDNAIEHSRKQLKSSGFMFDYSREIVTSDPSYYKWTQWLFLKLYERGLAYQKESPVNWCPKCLTVLANEQVTDGKCERCDAEVIQKEMKQWFFKVTDYADRLINDLDKVDWPESSVIKQRNWIGRSEGVEFEMDVVDEKYKIEVFTTRIDTVYGMTYVVLAPEHPLVSRITANEHKKEVEEYQAQTQKQTEIERQSLEKEKTGVFTGSYAVNPFNGEKVPIWIADYVLYGYGTGVVMAVPAHDERDYEFAKKYKLKIIESVVPKLVDKKNIPIDGKKVVPRRAIQTLVTNPKDGKMLTLKWKKLPWTTFITGGVDEGEDIVEAAKREVYEETGYKNLKFIRSLGSTETHFYAEHKDVNRIAYFTGLLFELEDDECDKPPKTEVERHESIWKSWREIDEDPNLTCAEYNLWKTRLKNEEQAYTGYGVLFNSGEFSGLTSEKAISKMGKWLEKKKIGKVKVNYRLHDWSFSRQRYWGAPIPIVTCEKCGAVPIPEKDLPVELPEKIKDFRPKGTGKGPLASVKDFVNTTCPKCDGKAERETDTMDTFVCSSFYFLRYPSVGNDKEMMNKEVTRKWLPVDMYVGGAEHVTMHLLYARFITKALYDAKLINFDEPFPKLRHQGYILGADGKKMSKSKGNVVNPDEVVKEHGADVFRTYILFMARFEDGGPWDPKGIVGIKRFLEKVWNIVQLFYSKGWLETTNEGTKELETGWSEHSNTEVEVMLNKTIKKVGEDIEGFRFNTAISALMMFINLVSNEETKSTQWISKQDFEKFLIILAPFAPFIAEELWEKMGGKESVHLQAWPKYDKSLIKDETVTIAVQINGKVRDEVVAVADAEEDEVLKLAKESKKVKKYLDGKTIKKVIYVKGKLLSIVISQ